MNDERLKKSVGDSRKDRAMEDREVTEDREAQDGIRFEDYVTALYQERLPTLPDIPGYHCVWGSTTHDQDLKAKLRAGYTAITRADLKGVDYGHMVREGEAEIIRVEEMIGLKIPKRINDLHMQHFHVNLPDKWEEAINEKEQEFRERFAKAGGKLVDPY